MSSCVLRVSTAARYPSAGQVVHPMIAENVSVCDKLISSKESKQKL
jgi:hypothetical protein